jgi:hypothetical protein
MRFFTLSIAIAACFILLACKKTRTCSCTYTQTNTTTTVPRSAAQSSTTVGSSTGEETFTYDKVKKDDMKRVLGCNSKTETSADTYTTIVTIPTQTSVLGYTYTTYVSVTADVNSTSVTDYKCDLK